MTQSTYDVSFNGGLVAGADLTQVKNNVASLFKTDVEKIEVMFSGKRVVVKRNLDEQTALKYQAAMKNAGAVCQITEVKPVATQAEPAVQPEPVSQPVPVAQEYSADNPPPIPPPASPEKPAWRDNLRSKAARCRSARPARLSVTILLLQTAA